MSAVASEVDWVIREKVAVTDAHQVKRHDPKTGKPYFIPLTEERLQKIADARNEKIKRTGDESPIVVGHTNLKPGYPEWLQPPIVGYADSYEVGPHPKDGHPTLFARHKFYPTSKVGGEELSAEEVMRRFPRRSPEIWMAENDIDAISLLGATTPQRYNGLLMMAKVPDLVAADMGANMEPQAGGDPLDQFMAMLMDAYEKIKGGPAQMEQPGAPPPPPGGDQTPAQMARGLTNNDRQRIAQEQESIRIVNLEKQLAAVQAEREQDKLQLRKERYEGVLRQFELENVELDRAAELADLLEMNDGMAAKHLDRIKTQYRRAGSSTFIRTAEPRPAGGGTIFDRPADHEQVKDLIMSGRAKSPEEARQMLKAG